MRRTFGSAAATLVVLALTACGGRDDGGGGGRGEVDPSTSPSSSTVAAAGAGVVDGDGGGDRPGCPANGGTVPAGATAAETIDMDGDGRRDRVWFDISDSGRHRVGVATASGAVLAQEFGTAKGLRGIVAVDADERGPVELLVHDGATASLFVLLGCDLVPVIGPDDAPYQFDLGYRGNGTGVLCVDADGDGRRDLVGVNEVRDSPTVSRTVVELDGARARHGHHDDQPPEEGLRYLGVQCGTPAIDR